MQKDDPALTAITTTNYKFSYKGVAKLEGRAVHVYQLKPRQTRNGLFKGHIYLNAYGGSLMRGEGKLVKSPSFFVKKINFVQDFADIDSFTFSCRRLRAPVAYGARKMFVCASIVEST